MPDNTEKQSRTRGLRPWQPGQSGNPNGRPKKEHCLVTMIEQYLSFTPDQLKTEAAKPELDIAHRLALKYIMDCNDDAKHTDKLMDRLYGQAQSAIDFTSKGKAIQAPPIFQIVGPESKDLLVKLQNGDRTSNLETNDSLQPERSGIPSGEAPKSE